MIVFTGGPLQSLRLSLQILHTVDKEAEMIDFHQILTVLSRLVFEGCVWNFINYHIWLVTSPDSIIAQCFQTSLSRYFARGGDGWNSGQLTEYCKLRPSNWKPAFRDIFCNRNEPKQRKNTAWQITGGEGGGGTPIWNRRGCSSSRLGV